MLGISGTELVIILFFGFLIFGPEKLPQMGRTVGRAIRQFRTASEAANQKFKDEIYDPFKDAVEPYAQKVQEETGGLKEDLEAINKTFNETKELVTDPLGFKGGSSKNSDNDAGEKKTDSIKDMVNDIVNDPLGMKKAEEKKAEEALAAADEIIDTVEGEQAERQAAMQTAKKSKVKKGLAESLYDLDESDPFAAELDTAADTAAPATAPAASAASNDPFAELDAEEAPKGGE